MKTTLLALTGVACLATAGIALVAADKPKILTAADAFLSDPDPLNQNQDLFSDSGIYGGDNHTHVIGSRVKSLDSEEILSGTVVSSRPPQNQTDGFTDFLSAGWSGNDMGVMADNGQGTTAAMGLIRGSVGRFYHGEPQVVAPYQFQQGIGKSSGDY